MNKNRAETAVNKPAIKADPQPVQIVKSKPDHTLEFDKEALEKILLSEDVRNLPIAVISVAGAFRKEKSFLCNFLLRYLQSGGKRGWIGGDDEPLTGFSWRSGADGDTTGIWAWSKAFVVTTAAEEKIAVLLLDTQGEPTVRDGATSFALSTMISSVQIYFLDGNIQEYHLQHLQYLVSYGLLALENTGATPFQSLMFYIPDWSIEPGSVGGNQQLKDVLKIRNSMSQKQKSVREHINSCFSELSGFAMPQPGLNVIDQHFGGPCLKDFKRDYRREMANFCPQILSASNLIAKKINGDTLKAKELIPYFEKYFEIFNADELPAPESVFQAIAEANNEEIVTDAFELYGKITLQFLQVLEVLPGSVPEKVLEAAHESAKEQAMMFFRSQKKMGGAKIQQHSESVLENKIDEMREKLQSTNNRKKSMEFLKKVKTTVKVAAVGVCVIVAACAAVPVSAPICAGRSVANFVYAAMK